MQERGHKVVDSGKQTLTLFLLRFLLQHSNPIRNNKTLRFSVQSQFLAATSAAHRWLPWPSPAAKTRAPTRGCSSSVPSGVRGTDCCLRTIPKRTFKGPPKRCRRWPGRCFLRAGDSVSILPVTSIFHVKSFQFRFRFRFRFLCLFLNWFIVVLKFRLFWRWTGEAGEERGSVEKHEQVSRCFQGAYVRVGEVWM